MPTLIQNYQKKQTVTQLKKAYSELSQAFNLAQKDNGTFDSWDLSDFETPADRSKYFYDNYLAPNLKILKSCVPTSSSECWGDNIKTISGTIYPYAANGTAGRASFITASGYSVYFWIHGVGTGGWFFIDINGKKQPNMLGKDVFVFLNNWRNLEDDTNSVSYSRLGLRAYGLHKISTPTREQIMSGDYPFKTYEDAGGCAKDSLNSPGVGCAAIIMLDGWEIAPDYPW